MTMTTTMDRRVEQCNEHTVLQQQNATASKWTDPDIENASEEAARRMASPAQHDNQLLERLAKYMNGAASMMFQLFS